MRQIYPDLWQSQQEHPLAGFPELISHAYLLVRDESNVLFYSTGREAISPVSDADDLRHIGELGGVTRQYLGHYHEATPAMMNIKEMFGSKLCCYAPEKEAVSKASGVPVDLTFMERETHPGGIEVIPTPGHTPGSASYLYKSPHGKTYLFTGDTIWFTDDGAWKNGYIRGESSKSALKESLETLRTLKPDVVFPAATGKSYPFKELSPGEWQAAVDDAMRPLVKELS